MENKFKPLSDRFRTHEGDLVEVTGERYEELLRKYKEQYKNNKDKSN